MTTHAIGGHQRPTGQYCAGPFEVRSLTPSIGAAVHRCDLRTPLDPATSQLLQALLLRHRVLVFYGQELTAREFVALGRGLGHLLSYPPMTLASDTNDGHGVHKEHPEVMTLEYDRARRGREAFWHFDVTPSGQPSRATILRSRVLPAVGGDTLFCDLTLLYEGLSDRRKEELDSARGIHDTVFQRNLARYRGKPEEEVMSIARHVPLDRSPIVVKHPADERRLIYWNPGFFVGVEGMPAIEFESLASELRSRVAKPEYQCRLRWEEHCVVMWDNRACLHYGVNDYWPMPRMMERITLLDLSPTTEPQPLPRATTSVL